MSGQRVRTVCVTGASGFVASHIVDRLLAAGHRVRATVRDPDDASKCAHLRALAVSHGGDLELHAADLLAPGSFDRAMRGCDALVHTAAAAIFAARDPQRQIVDVAVDGTRNVLSSVAKTASIERVVMTSSAAAILSYGRPRGTAFNEDDWCDSDDLRVDPYGIAKTRSERCLWSFAAAHAGGLDVVSLNPGVALGPPLARAHLRASISTIRKLLTRAYPACPRVRIWAVDVRDVAAAHVRALERAEAGGQRVLVTGQPLWIRDISAALAPRYHVPLRTLPDLLVEFAAAIDKSLSRRFMHSLLGYEYELRSSRMSDLLGLEYADTRRAIVEAADTMVERGWVDVKPR